MAETTVCPHTRQYRTSDGWVCRRCGVFVEAPPERDWSDGQAPFIAPDIADHLNITAGQRISSRREMRELMAREGLEPVERPLLTSKNPGDKLQELAEISAKAEEARWQKAKATVAKVSLEEFALKERREKSREPIKVSS